jgi:hypothetical protein
MADKIFQTCNGCGKVNDALANNWVRIWGVTLGRALQPIQPRAYVDFCPDCAAKTTADKLPSLAAPKIVTSKTP